MIQKNLQTQFFSVEFGLRHLMFDFLKKFTPIKRREIAVPHLNTYISHFRHLKTVKFLYRKIIPPKVQYHALGWLMTDLISQKKIQRTIWFTKWKRWTKWWKMSKNGSLKLFEYSSDFIQISTVDSNNHAHQCKTIDRSNRLSILCQYFELLTQKKIFCFESCKNVPNYQWV